MWRQINAKRPKDVEEEVIASSQGRPPIQEILPVVAMEYGREFYGPPRPPHMAREHQPEAQRPRWQHDQDDVRKEVTTTQDRGIAPEIEMREATPSPEPVSLFSTRRQDGRGEASANASW